MKVIIIGAGEVGYHIADILSKEKQDVILVDRDEERLKELAETLDVMTLHGSGSSPEILKKAGLGEADMVIAVTDSDETNMVACLLASTQSRVSFKIARIRNPQRFPVNFILRYDRNDIISTNEHLLIVELYREEEDRPYLTSDPVPMPVLSAKESAVIELRPTVR